MFPLLLSIPRFLFTPFFVLASGFFSPSALPPWPAGPLHRPGPRQTKVQITGEAQQASKLSYKCYLNQIRLFLGTFRKKAKMKSGRESAIWAENK